MHVLLLLLGACVVWTLQPAAAADEPTAGRFSAGGGSIHVGGRIPAHGGDASSGAGELTRSLSALDGVPYHNADTLVCADCHVMHASLRHSYDGTNTPGPGYPPYPAIFEPTPRLLKSPDPVDLCLGCHDGQAGIPDVLETDTNALGERSAGHFETPELMNFRGHDLGRGLPRVPGQLCSRCHWGDPADRKVTCIDCHNPHGNGNPRNLQWASDPPGTPPLGLFTRPGTTGPEKFERDNTSYGTLDSVDLREASNICLDCHHVFTGAAYNDPDGDDIHSLHPSYDSERLDPNTISQGLIRGTTDPAHWEAGNGAGFNNLRVPFVVPGATEFTSALIVDATANGVFCLSCHKAHGSDIAFGLTWVVTGAGEDLGCEQCHNKTGL